MDDDKKIILIFNEYYLPGYKAGGPIRSVSNLVSWLGDEVRFKIFTTDRDSFETKPYPGVEVDSWNSVNNAEVYYCSKASLNIRTILKFLKHTEFDLVYFNSLFNLYFTLVPLFLLKHVLKFGRRKIVLAPRGELDTGDLENKHLKKQLFIRIANCTGIYSGIKWQATNEVEKNSISEYLSVNPDNISVVSNLAQKHNHEPEDVTVTQNGTLKIVYLSRVTPKKNLLFALDVLASISDQKVQFDIYGVIDDEKYWAKCKNKIQKLGANIDVNYKGILKHHEVINVISDYHLFFLPTKGENFGHAIYESIIAGTPVLISTETPWKMLEEKEVGWDLPLSRREKFVEVIRNISKLSGDQIRGMKENVQEQSRLLDPNKVEHYRDLFNLQ